MTINKLLYVTLMLLFASSAFAQMSEDKIIQYVSEQQAKGVSQEQIIVDLSSKGVTVEQLQQMRNKYEKQKTTGVLGNTISSSDLNIKQDRTRSSNSSINEYRLQENNTNYSSQERLQEMYDQSMFLFTDSIYLLKKSLMPKKEIYGHNIFQNKSLTFEPNTNIATPRNYKLGPGDEVIIDIWGASQVTVRETISPDGNIMVDDLGPVYLNGMTVLEADKYIKKVFSQIYSGLDGNNANSSIKLTLGQNRSIQVNVMGEVVNPGTYTLSSFATIFNALYMAGGVNEIGTMRDIKLYRENKPIASIDIYDYLFNGTIKDDIRLNDNDVIMVSPYKMMVVVDGKIRRPMFYEMKENESLSQLVDYAGGLAPNAYKKDVRLVRMSDLQREIFTVSTEKQKNFLLSDGDSVYVDSIQTTFSNLVEIRGAVYRPGQFQIDGGISTLKELIGVAGGLKEDAMTTRALLSRTNPDKTLSNMSIDIKELLDGSFADVKLQNGDILFIPSIFDVQEVQTFSIFGEVLFPGDYKYADNTQIEDLILQAGGLKESASISKVDVVRRSRDRSALKISEKMSETFTFSVDEHLKIQDNDFTLMPFDEVYIRKSPGYSENKRVKIEGEILFPGYYSLSTNNEKLSDLIGRAGMFTPEAFPAGARLERKMTSEEKLRMKDITKLLSSKDSLALSTVDLTTSFYVGINLKEAVDNPGGPEDIVLRDGDRLIVPQFTNTVKINGEVMYSNTTTYQKGKNLSYYIDKAGGFSQNAKKNKSYIVYLNGSVAKARKGNAKLIQPGCEVIVPAKQERKGMSTSEILSMSSTSASLATVVLALINLLR